MLEYGLMNYLQTFIDSGHFPKNSTWKRIVKHAVQSHEQTNWLERMDSDSDFQIFKNIHRVLHPHPAWTISSRHKQYRKHAHFMVSICCLIRKPHNDPEVLCDRCGKFFEDPSIHAICNCDSNNETRDEFWSDVININPIDFNIHLGNMTDLELTWTLLSCHTDFQLDDDHKETFEIICVKYFYKLCSALNSR